MKFQLDEIHQCKDGFAIDYITQQMVPEIEMWCESMKSESTIYYRPQYVVIDPKTFMPVIPYRYPGILIKSNDEAALNIFLLKWQSLSND